MPAYRPKFKFLFSKIKQVIFNKKSIGILFVFILFGLTIPGVVKADFWGSVFGATTKLGGVILDVVAYALGWVVIPFLGSTFVLLVSILVNIAQFNNFIGFDAVKTGWGLARDVANMFFIVVLLVIAFSTILKIQSYHYQKTLSKLIIMAILINFSKLIAGFLIDFFQVIMLTFVNGFKDVAGGNLAQGMGIYDMLSKMKDATNASATGAGSEAIGFILAVVLLIVGDMTILIMISVLLWRIIMLWMLVIISPFAYLAYAGMPKYWSQWWSEFFKHLISGPVIAFFLWLTFLTIQKSANTNLFNPDKVEQTVNAQDKNAGKYFGSNLGTEQVMNFMVVVAMMLGGLSIANKMAAQSGSAVGNFASKVQKYGTRAAMLGTGAAAIGWMGRKGIPDAYKWGARKIGQKSPGMYSFLRADQTIKKFKEGLQHKSQLEEMEIETEQGKALEEGGLRGLVAGMGSRDFAYNVHGFLGVKGMKNIVKSKAQTARSIAKEIEDKKEKQQKHMEMVNRPNRDKAFIDDLSQEKELKIGDRALAESEFETIKSKPEALLEEHSNLMQEASKMEEQLEKDIKRGVIAKGSDAYNVYREEIDKKINQAIEKEDEAKKIKLDPEYQEEFKRAAVQALGYQEARNKGYINSSDIGKIKDIEGNNIDKEDTIFYKTEQAEREYKQKQELYEKAKKGDGDAQNKLDETAKNYFENKYKELEKQKELLEAGGLSESQKKSKKDEIKVLDAKIKTAEKDKEFITDQAELKKLDELIKATKKSRNKLQAQIQANSANDIKKLLDSGDISEDEIKNNKEDNKEFIEDITDKMAKYKNYNDKPVLTIIDREGAKEKVKEIEKDIKKDKEKLKKISALIPQAYYSRQAGRIAMNEEMKKIDTSNEDELISLFNNALTTGNKSKALAVTAAAAKVGHLNEIIQSQKASNDIKDDKGDILVKAGEYFSSGIEGLHAFTKDILRDKLGMSEQNAYGYENDFSDMAQEAGHWTFAQAMSVENGQFVQRDRHTQQTAVSIEKGKQDFENLMRRTNRLGWTTEKYADPTDPSSGRITVLNAEGIDAIRSNFKAITASIGKQRFNINLAGNLTTNTNMRVLNEIGKSLPAHEKKEWNNFINSLLMYVNKTKDQAMSDRVMGNIQSRKITEADKLRRRAGIKI